MSIATNLAGVRHLETFEVGSKPTRLAEKAPLFAKLKEGEKLVSVWREYISDKPSDYYACTEAGEAALRAWAFREFRHLNATMVHPRDRA